jgi:hypothetical protein
MPDAPGKADFYQVKALLPGNKNSIPSFGSGETSATPCALISSWAISLPASSCSKTHLNERNETVTNPLDEYSRLTASIRSRNNLN